MLTLREAGLGQLAALRTEPEPKPMPEPEPVPEPKPMPVCRKVWHPSLVDAARSLRQQLGQPNVIDPNGLTIYVCRSCRRPGNAPVFHLGHITTAADPPEVRMRRIQPRSRQRQEQQR